MKFTIESAAVSGREQLRTFLTDSPEVLAGAGARVLEPRLAGEGHPILLIDRQLHPVLVSFDTESSSSALVDGLRAADQLSSALPWLNQVYDRLQGQLKPLRLIVVSSETPAGADSILTQCPYLHLFRYTALRVNGQTSLWLEPLNNSTSPSVTESTVNTPAHKSSRLRGRDNCTPQVRLAPVPSKESSKLPALSDEERSFFQQL